MDKPKRNSKIFGHTETYDRHSYNRIDTSETWRRGLLAVIGSSIDAIDTPELGATVLQPTTDLYFEGFLKRYKKCLEVLPKEESRYSAFPHFRRVPKSGTAVRIRLLQNQARSDRTFLAMKSLCPFNIGTFRVATCCRSVASYRIVAAQTGNKAATCCRIVASMLPVDHHSNYFFEVLRLGLGRHQSENFHHSPHGYPDQCMHRSTLSWVR